MRNPYVKIIIETIGCSVADAMEIEAGIRTVGGFTALDHLTRKQIEQAPLAVAQALDIAITKQIEG
jgi:hypothetical protein